MTEAQKIKDLETKNARLIEAITDMIMEFSHYVTQGDADDGEAEALDAARQVIGYDDARLETPTEQATE